MHRTFPHNYVIMNFTKYRGKGSPIEHAREFHTACIDIAFEHTYLMRLFPRSLGGQCMEWFSKLPPGIRSFEEMVNKFITQYSYNIQHEITMKDLCNTKQKNGESLLTFIQRWR